MRRVGLLLFVAGALVLAPGSPVGSVNTAGLATAQHTPAQGADDRAEPGAPVIEPRGPQYLPWGWLRVDPPEGWQAQSSPSLTLLRFKRPGGETPARAWLAQLPRAGATEPLERIRHEDVRLELDGLAWERWEPRSPRVVRIGGREFAELRNEHDAGPQRVVALTLHGEAAIVLIVEGQEAETAWLRSQVFEFAEPVAELRGRLAFPALAEMQLPVPRGYQLEQVAPNMLVLHHPTGPTQEHGEDNVEQSEQVKRVLAFALDVPRALDLNEAFGELERQLTDSLGLRRHDARHAPRGRLDGLLAACTLNNGERAAWAWWGYDPANRTLLAVIHEHHEERAEPVERQLRDVILANIEEPEPVPGALLARIHNVRLAAHPLEGEGRQLGIVFLDEAGEPVAFRGLAFEARLRYANRPLPGVAEVVHGRDSRDVLPGGVRAGQLQLEPDTLRRIKELAPERKVTLSVRFDGHTVEEEVELGVLLAD